MNLPTLTELVALLEGWERVATRYRKRQMAELASADREAHVAAYYGDIAAGYEECSMSLRRLLEPPKSRGDE